MYVNQLAIWVTTLIELGGVPVTDLFVHVLDGEHGTDVVDLLSERGIAFAPMPRFGDGRFCNKVRQLRTAALRERPYVALCDTDLAFAGNLDRWVGLARAAGKPVDGPNPPVEMLEALYRRAGFNRFPERTRCAHADAPTYANNFNGGVYLLRSDLLDELSPLWEKWALWSLEQHSVLGSQVAHADQISFGLAMWELGEPVAQLPSAANFPLHLAEHRYEADPEPPVVLHYHKRVTAGGLLRPLGIPSVDDRVRLINETLTADRRKNFDNRRFWNFRYSEHAERGSGTGSRGRHVAEKQRLITLAIEDAAAASVLDVGCGDLEIARDLAVRDYVGLEISREAVRIAQEKRPEWRFVVGDLLSADVATADLVVCLDVLIHERNPQRYRASVKRLGTLARKALLVGAYNQEPWFTSSMTFFHEPISHTVLATGAFSSLRIVGGYRDTTVVLALRS
jgi:hypothetical protein